MIYLSSPYSDPDSAVRKLRYDAACAATVRLMNMGFNVFSPVVHNHKLAEMGLRGDMLYWDQFFRDVLPRCDELWFLEIPGTKNGNTDFETELAVCNDIPFKLINIDEISKMFKETYATSEGLG